MHDDQMHVALFSKIAALEGRVSELEDVVPQVTITIENVNVFHIGGNVDFTRLNAAAAKNTSVGDLLDSIFDAIAAAIRSNKTNQVELDKLATQLESDNVREELRVNAIKDLTVEGGGAPGAFTASWSGPSAASVGQAFSGSVTASGGSAPYIYTQESGSLPDGCTFASDGSVNGTPGTAGAFTFGGNATDAVGATAAWSASVSVS